MDPFQGNDTAQATRKGLAAKPDGTSPFERFSAWASAPIKSRDFTRTPAQVMARPAVTQKPAATPGMRSVPPAPTAPGLPGWAADQVQRGGGSPDAFHVEGSQLMSSRRPEDIAADVEAHPPISTPRAPAAAAVPSIGVPGPAQAAGSPGVRQDPARAALHAQLVAAHRDALNNGQGQWVFPPGTGTEPVWRANTAHERVAAYGNALANYDSAQSQLMQADPGVKLGLLSGIAHADPATRAIGAGSLGIDPAAAEAMPRPGYGNEPIDAAGSLDRGAAARYADPNIGLRDHLAAASGQPGIADPGHANHRAFQDWVNSRYANRDEWDQDTYVPPGPDDYQFNGPSFLAPIAKGWARASMGMFGPDRGQRVEQAGLLANYGIRPPGGVAPQ